MVSFIDSALGGASTPVSSNIQHYLAQATLPRLRLAACTPRMPSANHKTHRINLTVRPERYRRLRHIHRIKRVFFDVCCLDFIQKHIPYKPVQVDDVDPDAYEQPSIPCAGFDLEGFVPAPVRHIDGLSVMWLEDNILQTVQAILSMIPEYRDIAKNYRFACNDIMRDEDNQIFRFFMWERSEASDASPDSGDPSVKFILAYLPPWILGRRDMELLVDKRLRHLPSYDACMGSGQERYNSSHRLWAKLWDVCKKHECHSFVLTNYNQWVFGGFSKGWENGYTMGVKEAYPPDVNSALKPDVNGKRSLPRTPTILEYLVYWTVSSMHLPDSFEVPPVCKEVPCFPREQPCCLYDVRTKMDVACAAYFQELSSRLLASPVHDEIVIEPSVDDPLDDSLPPTLIPTHPDFPAVSANQQAFEFFEPSESDWSSGSNIPSSAGVRIGSESDSGLTAPPFLTDTWRIPMDSVVSKRNATNVTKWRTRCAFPDPAPVPSITRAPSPVRSEWSDRSLAALHPRQHQGFHNIDTTIIKEVYEYDFEDMDLA